MKGYRGDKYIKAYRHYRDQLDTKVNRNSARIAELERTIEWLIGRLLEELKGDE
jgi:hypothetical protein